MSREGIATVALELEEPTEQRRRPQLALVAAEVMVATEAVVVSEVVEIITPEYEGDYFDSLSGNDQIQFGD